MTAKARRQKSTFHHGDRLASIRHWLDLSHREIGLVTAECGLSDTIWATWETRRPLVEPRVYQALSGLTRRMLADAPDRLASELLAYAKGETKTLPERPEWQPGRRPTIIRGRPPGSKNKPEAPEPQVGEQPQPAQLAATGTDGKPQTVRARQIETRLRGVETILKNAIQSQNKAEMEVSLELLRGVIQEVSERGTSYLLQWLKTGHRPRSKSNNDSSARKGEILRIPNA